jgi:hypothetical protein
MEEIPLSGQGITSTVNPIRCDARGGIYFRTYTPRIFDAPILKFSADGKQRTVFSTESAKDWQEAHVLDFAIGADGRVHLLTSRPLRKERKIEFGIMAFSEDGKHLETIPIRMPLNSVDHIAAFPTGEYFIAGYRKIDNPQQEKPQQRSSETEDTRPEVEPVAAILDRSGTLIAEVKLPAGPLGVTEDSSDVVTSIPPGAIEGGMTTVGEDGNLYIIFRVSKPFVYVIAATGIVARTLSVVPPSEKAVALGLSVAQGVGLMVKFSERGPGSSYPTDKTVFSLISPQTGERLYDYQADKRLGPALACYTPRGLLFLGRAKEQLGILRAEPR